MIKKKEKRRKNKALLTDSRLSHTFQICTCMYHLKFKCTLCYYSFLCSLPFLFILCSEPSHCLLRFVTMCYAMRFCHIKISNKIKLLFFKQRLRWCGKSKVGTRHKINRNNDKTFFLSEYRGNPQH